MSIDHFMRSLAEQGNRAIGVILSGTGTDGTLGMAEIQAQGGVTFAQDEATAKYDSMPRSAIAAGCVDYVLPPKGIAKELARIAHHPYVCSRQFRRRRKRPALGEPGLNTIFQLFRRSPAWISPTTARPPSFAASNAAWSSTKSTKLNDYVKYVRSNPAEIKALYQDILINVTSFFRGPAMFRRHEVRSLSQDLEAPPARVPPSACWTPGCASGEETYSIAIALLEFLGDRAAETPIQFFGTDVSDTSITKARAGVYPENIQGDVSPERLRRFFTKVENGYRISKTIRDMCIFAQHNVLSDPPFSQMDVICCRNLLIYLEPILQTKVISLFHYASRSNGYLVLGSSEGVGPTANLFTPVDRGQKIFLKKSTAARQSVSFSLTNPAERAELGAIRVPAKPPDNTWNYLEAQKEFDRRLLSQYAPATVFINEDLEIIHTRGAINRYLKISPGRASLSVLKMAREGLLMDLRNAIARAKKDNVSVRKQNVEIKDSDSPRAARSIHNIRFEVVPITVGNLKEMYFMVVFQDESAEPRRGKSARRAAPQRQSEASTARILKLEQELSATKEYLQSVIETQEATNEELQSANEEILSSNEELQSTNEELETAKEELQSANEELTTVNDELRNRNIEVTQANNDLTNLFSSIDVAVIMIDRDLTIRRFTPEAQKFLGLIPADIGRPLLNINPTIEIPDFQTMVLTVMSTFHTVEKEIHSHDGARYQLRILPYHTSDDRIDGAVITIIAISSANAAP